MKYLLFMLMLTLSGCAPPPQHLSVVSTTAFQKTRVVKVLDLLRDTAIDASSEVPPVLSTATARKVVQAHQAALKAIQASDTGWPAAVSVILAQLSHDQTLLPTEAQRLAPYFELAAQVLKGL